MVDHHYHLEHVIVDGVIRRRRRFQPPSDHAVVGSDPLFHPPHGFHTAFPHEVFTPEILASQHLINSTAGDDGVVRGSALQHVLSVPQFEQPPSLAEAGVFAHSPPLPYIYSDVIPPPNIYPEFYFLDLPQDMFHGNIQEYLRPQERDAGISEDVVAKNLKTRTCCEATTSDEDDQEICVVCQHELQQENQTVGILKCGHEYHASCIKSWLQEKNVCPLCRAIAL